VATGSAPGTPSVGDPGNKISTIGSVAAADVSPSLGSVCGSGGVVAEGVSEAVAIEDLAQRLAGQTVETSVSHAPILMVICLRR